MESNSKISEKIELNSLKYKYSKILFLKSFTQEYKICSDIVYAFDCFSDYEKYNKLKFKSKKIKKLIAEKNDLDKNFLKDSIIKPNIRYLELIIEMEEYMNKMKTERLKIYISILIPLLTALIAGLITFITTYIQLSAK